MLSFILPLILTIFFSILSIIFLFKAFIKTNDKSNKYNIIATICATIITIITALAIEAPAPIIYPLDNETRVYKDEAEVTISSSDLFETYYSSDGSEPKEGDRYEAPFTITASATISARNKFFIWWSDIGKNSFKFEDDNNVPQMLTDKEFSEQDEVEGVDKIEESSKNQQYPDDYLIDWEDETFENFIKEALHKEKITYGDVKDIQTLYILDDKVIVDDYVDAIYIKTIEDGLPQSISLNDLKYFTSLYDLEVFNYEELNCDIFEDANFLKDLCALTIYINLQSNQFKQLAELKNLTYLYIDGSDITLNDLEIISKMQNIKSLGICGCNITDISPISNMKQLECLNLSCNNISNIDVLYNLYNLKEVFLYDNKIIDFSPVSHVETVIKTYDEFIEMHNDS